MIVGAFQSIPLRVRNVSRMYVNDPNVYLQSRRMCPKCTFTVNLAAPESLVKGNIIHRYDPCNDTAFEEEEKQFVPIILAASQSL